MPRKVPQTILECALEAQQVEELVIACTKVINNKGGVFTTPHGVLLVGDRLVRLSKLEIAALEDDSDD